MLAADGASDLIVGNIHWHLEGLARQDGEGPPGRSNTHRQPSSATGTQSVAVSILQSLGGRHSLPHYNEKPWPALAIFPAPMPRPCPDFCSKQLFRAVRQKRLA